MASESGDNIIAIYQDRVPNPQISLQNGGGDGTGGSMETRVAILETHMEYVRKDLAEIKESQKETTKTLAALTASLEKLPTKGDLWAWKFQWLAIALVVFATIVGGIIGGLDWIKTH